MEPNLKEGNGNEQGVSPCGKMPIVVSIINV